MTEKKPMMVVIRISEMPESPVPSTEKECGSCGKPVWVSNVNLLPSECCDLVCPPCLMARAATSQN